MVGKELVRMDRKLVGLVVLFSCLKSDEVIMLRIMDVLFLLMKHYDLIRASLWAAGDVFVRTFNIYL
jgi:hypothetical protein